MRKKNLSFITTTSGNVLLVHARGADGTLHCYNLNSPFLAMKTVKESAILSDFCDAETVRAALDAPRPKNLRANSKAHSQKIAISRRLHVEGLLKQMKPAVAAAHA